MSRYETVIGLEIHAELNTDTKIYCGCKNKFGYEANTLVCPICTGMPGTLPKLNSRVVEHCVKMGIALGCKINKQSKQDRKNYFYPDLPKGYQISQFDLPLCEGGNLDILVEGKKRSIGITRIHIEEDAGKTVHSDNSTGTLVDYNRCGVPLIEIVCEPDLRSAQESKVFLETIHSILLYIGISDAKMQEGSVRCDVNVSIRPTGQKELGIRCEMKNVNSFGAVYRSIIYESQRQMKLIAGGKKIEQQTRRWDDEKGESVLLRNKETAQDYRYFAEPDLSIISVEQSLIDNLKASVPELPVAKTIRYMQEFKLPFNDATLITRSKERAEFFENAISSSDNIDVSNATVKSVCNIINGELAAYLTKEHISFQNLQLRPSRILELVKIIEIGEISNTTAKIILEEMIKKDSHPLDIAKEKNLTQINDSGKLLTIVSEVLEHHPNVVADYKNGKTNVFDFLIGKCMKSSKGKGNPKIFTELLTDILK